MMLKMSARAYEAQKCCPDSRLTRYWDRADICHLFVVYKNIGILNVLLLLLLESIETCIMRKKIIIVPRQKNHPTDVEQLLENKATANARTLMSVQFIIDQSMYVWHHRHADIISTVRTYPEYEVEDEQQVFYTFHAALYFAHPASRFVSRARRFDQNVCANVQACLGDLGQ